MNETTFGNEGPAGLIPDPAATYAGGTTTSGPAKQVVLAGIGAVAVACDVAADTFDRFVERGRVAQEDAFRRADDVRLSNAGRRSRAGEVVRSAMNALLDGVNVPNKADVDIINNKLNIVSRKLDDLQMQSVGVSPSSVTPAAPEIVVPPVGLDDPVVD